jgi:acetyl esterase/lipase
VNSHNHDRSAALSERVRPRAQQLPTQEPLLNPTCPSDNQNALRPTRPRSSCKIPMFLGIFLSLFSAQSSEIRVKKDIEYARTESGPLALDLYLPPGNQQKSVIVWIHGGAWRSGSKTEMPLKEFVMEGHAAASIFLLLCRLAGFTGVI